MARTLISSPSFLGIPFPSSYRHRLPPQSRCISTKLKYSLHELPPIHSFDNSIDFNAIVTRAEGLLYTLADAAVAVDGGAASESANASAQKSGGWFGFISDAMEVVLKVICGVTSLFAIEGTCCSDNLRYMCISSLLHLIKFGVGVKILSCQIVLMLSMDYF